jgi:signal transduction histidine kinase
MAKSLTNHLALSSPADQEMAQDILHGLQDAVAEVRRIVRGLAPVDVDTFGLKAALQDLANVTTKYSDLRCEFVCSQSAEVADNAIATQLFRIAQESVNNAVKHSGANRITIKLEGDADCISMQVRDNGIGYNSSDHTTGMGLRIMQYRSNLIGAAFDVRTTKYGTTVACTLKQETYRG